MAQFLPGGLIYEINMVPWGAAATTRGHWARRRDNELESGKSDNVVFFAGVDLVILAIGNS